MGEKMRWVMRKRVAIWNESREICWWLLWSLFWCLGPRVRQRLCRRNGRSQRKERGLVRLVMNERNSEKRRRRSWSSRPWSFVKGTRMASAKICGGAPSKNSA